tara:strand:+ start:543 stop:1577 length:1035 start_codon:yes stop_codon:yes gene_type:complete
MEDYIIEIDSSQRDPNIYSDPNDYTIYLNKHIYSVESVELVCGKIPTTQYLINNGNRQFQVDDTTVMIPEGNYTSGELLASNLVTALVGTTNVTSVSYVSNTHSLVFSGTDNFSFKFYSGSNGFSTSSQVGTPFNVLGFSGQDTEFTNRLESGYVDLMGPTNLIIKISCNDEECRKDMYTTNDSFSFNSNTWNYTDVGSLKNEYTGRLNIFKDNNYNMIDFKSGDPVNFRFNKCSDKSINRLRIQWFYNVGNKLIPYNFNGRNHFMKIKIRGSTDKLNVLPRMSEISHTEEKKSLEEPGISKNYLDWKYYAVLVLIFAMAVFIWSRHTRAASPVEQDLCPQTAL